MKRARLIVLAIAIAAAGGAAMLAKGLITTPKEIVVTRTDYDTKQVLIAKKAIKRGDTILASDLQWQEWPAKIATNEFITKSNAPRAIKDYTKAVARASFLSGEPINKKKLIKVGKGGVLAAILESGMRAISTSIREETAAGGFILPEDRVDVIVTQQRFVMNFAFSSGWAEGNPLGGNVFYRGNQCGQA